MENNHETSFKDLASLNKKLTKTKERKKNNIIKNRRKRAYFQIIRNNVSIIASAIVSFVYQADDFLVKSSSAIVERIEKKRERGGRRKPFRRVGRNPRRKDGRGKGSGKSLLLTSLAIPAFVQPSFQLHILQFRFLHSISLAYCVERNGVFHFSFLSPFSTLRTFFFHTFFYVYIYIFFPLLDRFFL